jgi:predicted MPP superfamily phosphohydrolase
MARLAALEVFLALLALGGHFSISVWLFNRLHATAWPRARIKQLEKVLLPAAALVLAFYFLGWWSVPTASGFLSGPSSVSDWIWLGYPLLCLFATAAAIPLWLIPKLAERLPSALISNDTTVFDIAQRLGFAPIHGAGSKLLARVPGNEIFRLAVQRKTLRLDRLPTALGGLSIAHLSDLHLTGHLGREYFDVVIEQTNALDPDLVVITGDILDKEQCLPWIVPIFGRLQAKHGKYFILGNHETGLADVPALRAALVEAGLVDLGSRYECLTINGADILLAGTELPWFGTAPEFKGSGTKGVPGVQGSAANLSTEYLVLGTPADNPKSKIGAPAPAGHRKSVPEPRTLNPETSFRILLSHTPDQLPWAKANGFDLMLAGHNHGGQIRLPYLGALISPSKYGFRYAGGLYHEPPTLLHVSRGISGIQTIRLNCPPELALLVLHSTRSTTSGSGGTG